MVWYNVVKVEASWRHDIMHGRLFSSQWRKLWLEVSPNVNRGNCAIGFVHLGEHLYYYYTRMRLCTVSSPRLLKRSLVCPY